MSEVSANRPSAGMVLIVDDEPRLAKAASRLLTSMGFEVLIAEGGRQAVEVCRAHADKIDLVLLDLVLREMTSMEALRQMRALNPAIKVILMSGYSKQESLDRFADVQPDGFLPKPFGYRELETLVRAALCAQGSRRE